MKRLLIAALFVVAPILHAHADDTFWKDTTGHNRDKSALLEAGDACDRQVGPDADGQPTPAVYKRCMRQYGWRLESRTRTSPQQRRPGITVWNRDSRDPNVGWHTVNGMRVCSHDCDNPEIPGSGAVCTDLGNGWRDCVTDGTK